MRLLRWLVDFIEWNIKVSGVVARGKPPSDTVVQRWLVLGKPLRESRCCICNNKTWAWRDSPICDHFPCYHKHKRRETG